MEQFKMAGKNKQASPTIAKQKLKQTFINIYKAFADRFIINSFLLSTDEMMSMYTIAATEFAISGTQYWLDIISTALQ